MRTGSRLKKDGKDSKSAPSPKAGAATAHSFAPVQSGILANEGGALAINKSYLSFARGFLESGDLKSALLFVIKAIKMESSNPDNAPVIAACLSQFQSLKLAEPNTEINQAAYELANCLLQHQKFVALDFANQLLVSNDRNPSYYDLHMRCFKAIKDKFFQLRKDMENQSGLLVHLESTVSLRNFEDQLDRGHTLDSNTVIALQREIVTFKLKLKSTGVGMTASAAPAVKFRDAMDAMDTIISCDEKFIAEAKKANDDKKPLKTFKNFHKAGVFFAIAKDIKRDKNERLDAYKNAIMQMPDNIDFYQSLYEFVNDSKNAPVDAKRLTLTIDDRQTLFDTHEHQAQVLHPGIKFGKKDDELVFTGVQKLMRQEFEAALLDFTNAKEYLPADALIFVLTGIAHAFLKNKNATVQQCEQALQRTNGETYLAAYNLLASNFLEREITTNAFSEVVFIYPALIAIQDYPQIFRDELIKSQRDKLKQLLDADLANGGLLAKKESDCFLALAKQCLDPKKAAMHCAQSLAIYPNAPEALVLCAENHFKLGKQFAAENLEKLAIKDSSTIMQLNFIYTTAFNQLTQAQGHLSQTQVTGSRYQDYVRLMIRLLGAKLEVADALSLPHADRIRIVFELDKYRLLANHKVEVLTQADLGGVVVARQLSAKELVAQTKAEMDEKVAAAKKAKQKNQDKLLALAKAMTQAEEAAAVTRSGEAKIAELKRVAEEQQKLVQTKKAETQKAETQKPETQKPETQIKADEAKAALEAARAIAATKKQKKQASKKANREKNEIPALMDFLIEKVVVNEQKRQQAERLQLKQREVEEAKARASKALADRLAAEAARIAQKEEMERLAQVERKRIEAEAEAARLLAEKEAARIALLKTEEQAKAHEIKSEAFRLRVEAAITAKTERRNAYSPPTVADDKAPVMKHPLRPVALLERIPESLHGYAELLIALAEKTKHNFFLTGGGAFTLARGSLRDEVDAKGVLDKIQFDDLDTAVTSDLARLQSCIRAPENFQALVPAIEKMAPTFKGKSSEYTPVLQRIEALAAKKTISNLALLPTKFGNKGHNRLASFSHNPKILEEGLESDAFSRDQPIGALYIAFFKDAGVIKARVYDPTNLGLKQAISRVVSVELMGNTKAEKIQNLKDDPLRIIRLIYKAAKLPGVIPAEEQAIIKELLIDNPKLLKDKVASKVWKSWIAKLFEQFFPKHVFKEPTAKQALRDQYDFFVTVLNERGVLAALPEETARILLSKLPYQLKVDPIPVKSEPVLGAAMMSPLGGANIDQKSGGSRIVPLTPLSARNQEASSPILFCASPVSLVSNRSSPEVASSFTSDLRFFQPALKRKPSTAAATAAPSCVGKENTPPAAPDTSISPPRSLG